MKETNKVLASAYLQQRVMKSLTESRAVKKESNLTHTTPPPVNRRMIGTAAARLFSTRTVSSTALLRPTTTQGGVPELMTHQLLESCRKRLSSRRSMRSTGIFLTWMTLISTGSIAEEVLTLRMKRGRRGMCIPETLRRAAAKNEQNVQQHNCPAPGFLQDCKDTKSQSHDDKHRLLRVRREEAVTAQRSADATAAV
jgi:hypothetical protein